VEHVFAVMKLKFGFVKVRYRGIAKNANRLFATCALVNLFLARKTLLGMTAAWCVPQPPHRSHGADAAGLASFELYKTAARLYFAFVRFFARSTSSTRSL